MGYPFAASKIDDMKDLLSQLQKNMIAEIKETKSMEAEVQQNKGTPLPQFSEVKQKSDALIVQMEKVN